jgi:hypothetical protein
VKWNTITGAVNYPVRIKSPSGAVTSIGAGATGDLAPTGTAYTFTDLPLAGTYTYWGHSWNPTAGLSTATDRTVSCSSVTVEKIADIDIERGWYFGSAAGKKRRNPI